MRTEGRGRCAVAAAALACLSACGEGPGGCQSGQMGSPSSCRPTFRDTVPAIIAAKLDGCLEVHPSVDPDFAVAVRAPIRITETSGGTASWDFARIGVFLRGAEIERNEVGADVLAAAGYGRIAARSDAVYTVVYRLNSDDFDEIRMTLGFSDLEDGRRFGVDVLLLYFSDCGFHLDPLSHRGDGQQCTESFRKG